MRKKEEERRKFRDETEENIRKVLKTKPLYTQIEERFHYDVELPELEEKKRALKEMRRFH